jgi:hypothetical protein
MSHFDFLPTLIFCWMLDFPLAPRLQFVSIQGRFAQIAFLPVSGLLWLAFWLYNVYRFICKKAALSWQGALNSK